MWDDDFTASRVLMAIGKQIEGKAPAGTVVFCFGKMQGVLKIPGCCVLK